MGYDYWHIRRYLRLQGTREEDVLPFALPQIVIGNVVCLREPVWKSAVATALSLGLPDIFTNWRWQSPLSVTAAATAVPALRAIVDRLSEGKAVTFPPELAEDNLPAVDAVINTLRVLHDLLVLARERGKAVETWSE